MKKYEPVLKHISAEYDPMSGNYYITIGNKEVGHIHNYLFETLFVAVSDHIEETP